MNAHDLAVVAVWVGVAACVAHSLVRRGRDVTWRLFLLSTVFWLLKGGLDVPRHVEEMPYVMHVELFMRGRFNIGAFLVFVLGLRTVATYVALTLAERLLAARPERRGRYFATVGLSIFLHGLIGMGFEYLSIALHWWTWKPELEAFWGHYFATWGMWSAYAYTSILVGFTTSGTPRRQLLRGLLHAFFWTIGIILASAIAPMLRNLILFPGALALMLSGFSKRGPMLRPMRRERSARASDGS